MVSMILYEIAHNNRKCISIAPKKVKSHELAYSQALNYNRINRQVRSDPIIPGQDPKGQIGIQSYLAMVDGLSIV